MHFFMFHIGDYIQSTAHLSNDEDLAYRRLLDYYYDTEQPIPNDIARIARRIRIDSAVVETVLNEFFTSSPSGWTNARCESDIARYRAMSEGGRKGADKRWHSQANRVANREANGEGNREVNGEAIGGLCPPDSPPNANHKPLTNNHSFRAPSEKDVFDCMVSRGMSEAEADIQSKKFVAYHESKGWVVGKSKMRKWQAAVTTWLMNGKSDHVGAGKRIDPDKLSEMPWDDLVMLYKSIRPANCPSRNGINFTRQDVEDAARKILKEREYAKLVS